MKGKTFLYHSVFWLGIYLLWVLIFRSYSFAITKTMTVEFCYLLFITADFYAINNFIVPKFLLGKKYVLFLMATLIIIAVSALFRALVAEQMNLYFFCTVPIDFRTVYLNSIVNISLWVLLVTIIKMLIDRMQTQQRLETLENERIKNELDHLKAQINPHALLNSLNTVYGYIDKRNQTARNILLQFSELLKYQLYECGTERVALEKEIAYIKNYIAFQQLRKEENVIVNSVIENSTSGLKIAPLLLIVLIENAFKFVSNFADRENKIDIKIFIEDDRLHCWVSNTKEAQAGASNKDFGGIGMVNLKRRLALLYDEKHVLTIKDEASFYETFLTISLT